MGISSPLVDLQHQYDLLQKEYEYEKETYRQQSERTGLRKRVAQGLCWYPVTPGRSYYNSLNQLVIEIERTEDREIEHNFEYAAQIDGEVLSIINKCYDDAMQLLIENRESLDKISEYLYEHETITGKEFMKIFREIKGIPEPEEESTKKSFMEQAMDAERQSKGNDGE